MQYLKLRRDKANHKGKTIVEKPRKIQLPSPETSTGILGEKCTVNHYESLQKRPPSPTIVPHNKHNRKEAGIKTPLAISFLRAISIYNNNYKNSKSYSLLSSKA